MAVGAGSSTRMRTAIHRAQTAARLLKLRSFAPKKTEAEIKAEKAAKKKMKVALIINLWISVLVFASSIQLIIETVPELRKDYEAIPGHNTSFVEPPIFDVWWFLETFFVLNFLVEYLVRVGLAIKKRAMKAFCKGFLNIVDLVAIIPYFVELPFTIMAYYAKGSAEEDGSDVDIGTFRIVRVISLVRVVRVIRILRYAKGKSKTGTSAMRRSLASMKEIFITFLFILLLLILLISCGFYFIEKGRDANDYESVDGVRADRFGIMTTMYSNETFISGYPSIPEAIWQTFVTVTVVGYGDVSPSTHLGRFVGVLAMFLGIFVVALPTGLFSGQFADDWDESKDQGDLTAEEEALANGPPQGRYSVLPTGVAMRRVSVCAPADESVKEQPSEHFEDAGAEGNSETKVRPVSPDSRMKAVITAFTTPAKEHDARVNGSKGVYGQQQKVEVISIQPLLERVDEELLKNGGRGSVLTDKKGKPRYMSSLLEDTLKVLALSSHESSEFLLEVLGTILDCAPVLRYLQDRHDKTMLELKKEIEEKEAEVERLEHKLSQLKKTT
eukprot:CAMPEP_0113872738 /NCGR_PEP_ID=MMETSP0780_2-20120614/3384_1 /TAXON_ID=652834 /ORGANISM="Palpitomonas bilix" /LENGTH=555 /DNA_ID=CAMNT_0000858311 /DNA_START=396 /DNA_END=2063 /DNA_ORIENTATION=+ /assembly_acc=CAM_ASM_000599